MNCGYIFMVAVTLQLSSITTMTGQLLNTNTGIGLPGTIDVNPHERKVIIGSQQGIIQQ